VKVLRHVMARVGRANDDGLLALPRLTVHIGRRVKDVAIEDVLQVCPEDSIPENKLG
jgi:hypothetical protein